MTCWNEVAFLTPKAEFLGASFRPCLALNLKVANKALRFLNGDSKMSTMSCSMSFEQLANESILSSKERPLRASRSLLTPPLVDEAKVFSLIGSVLS